MVSQSFLEMNLESSRWMQARTTNFEGGMSGGAESQPEVRQQRREVDLLLGGAGKVRISTATTAQIDSKIGGGRGIGGGEEIGGDGGD